MEFLKRNVEIFKTPCSIWEPACGDLHISKVLESYGHSVLSTDISTGTDYLIVKPVRRIDAIITNPPFKLSDQFITKGLQDSAVLCLLLKSQCWHSKKKALLFKDYPPTYVLPLTWRVDFLNGAKGARPTMEVLWTVWLPNNPGYCIYQPLFKP